MMLLAALVCTAVYSGVCVVHENGDTPQCPRTKPKTFTAQSDESIDAAVRALAAAVSASGNTVKLMERDDEKRGKTYYVEGWGFVCRPAEKDGK